MCINRSLISGIIGANDWLCAIDSVDLQVAHKYATPPDPPGNLEFFLLVNTIMPPFEMPKNIKEALELYILLITKIESYL